MLQPSPAASPTDPPQRLVEVQDVSRSYGRVQALRGVTLSLAPGTIGLVGNNGAGKSTLLKILLGLLAPDAGRGTILGYDIRHSGHRLRGRVGYMPEAAATVPMLKGVEFVALSGDLYGMPHRHAKRRAHEVLNYVGLGEMRYRRLEEYSVGNLQRMKLAAALVHDPQLLLLDEPTGGLDPQGRTAMLRLIEDLITETGKSVILCTHLLSDVERLCEQVVVLHRGTVLKSGRIEELRQVQGNRFELAWHGACEPLAEQLRQRGCQVAVASGAGRMVAVVPPQWNTTMFFQAAQAAGAVLTHLKPDEEDLERLFFRLTEGDHSATSSSSVPPAEVAHGH